jgi:two-component system OmpR family response regulator
LQVLVVRERSTAVAGLGEALRAAGVRVEVAPAGVRCLEQIHSLAPDVVLAEFGAPGTAVLLRELPAMAKRPGVLFVVDASAGTVDAAQLCLADDHVRPDCDPAELVLRLEVLVARRTSPAAGARFEAGRVQIDHDARQVLAGGRPVRLSATEFELLLLLVRNAGRVVTKSAILDHVWRYEFQGESNIVESYIYGLRRKLSDEDRSLIKTIRGIGYLFADDRSS